MATRADNGRFYSEGSRLLCETVNKRGGQAAVAAELEVSRPTLNRWVTGERRPGFYGRQLMFQRLGIPMTSWDGAPAHSRTGTDG